jgi:hypothetical protein
MPEIDRPTIRPDGLQINDNRPYQERFWSTQRGAWLCFVAITFAAALGATGAGGPLSRGSAAFETAGRIDYPAVGRWQAGDHLVVTFSSSGSHSLQLSPSFAEAFQIETVRPDPQASIATADGLELQFGAGEGPARAYLQLRPQAPGVARYQARIDGGTPQDLTTIILP